jgi:hypothetical protein
MQKTQMTCHGLGAQARFEFSNRQETNMAEAVISRPWKTA